jgi:DNA replication protein DnaC
LFGFLTKISKTKRETVFRAQKIWTFEIGSIDEVGYLELDRIQASLLFQTIGQRYERKQATVLTSNKAFSEWGHVFANDPVMASAALDRLLHLSTVINIRGDSYRLNEKRKAGMKMPEKQVQQE